MKSGILRCRRNILWGLSLAVTSAVCLIYSETAYGQGYRNQFVPYSTVGVGIGTSNYYGELGSLRRVIPSTFKMIRWSATGEYTRHFSPRFAARASLTWAQIAGDDYKMNRSGSLVHKGYFIRNLHFQNNVKELAAVGIFKLTPDGRSYDRRQEFGAYVFAGVGLFAHNPKARLPLPVDVNERQRWVALQPLGTEGQGTVDGKKIYSLVSFAVPVGFGFRYKINPKFDVAAELGFRFTTTDYLDDAAGHLPHPNSFYTSTNNPTLTEQMAVRALEERPARFPKKDRRAILQKYLGLGESQDPFAEIRNHPDKISLRQNAVKMDNYMTGTVKLVYVLGPSVKCPPLK